VALQLVVVVQRCVVVVAGLAAAELSGQLPRWQLLGCVARLQPHYVAVVVAPAEHVVAAAAAVELAVLECPAHEVSPPGVVVAAQPVVVATLQFLARFLHIHMQKTDNPESGRVKHRFICINQSDHHI